MGEIILIDKMSYDYFQAFLDSLCSLTDKELQNRVWAGGDCSVYTSFDEVYMHFSDLCEDILTWDLPTDKSSLIKTLYEMVEEYHEHCNQQKKTEKEICNDPEWHEIREFAKRVHDNLKHVKYIPKEG